MDELDALIYERGNDWPSTKVRAQVKDSSGRVANAIVVSSYWNGEIPVIASNRIQALAAATRIANKRGCMVSVALLKEPGVSQVSWLDGKEHGD